LSQVVRNIIIILSLLLVSYAGARLFGGSNELAGRVSIAALFGFTALGHLAKPTEMLEMLPPSVPSRRLVVLLSGFLELAFALGILIPVYSRLTAIAAIVILFLAAPLNIYSAFRRVNFGGHAAGPAYLWVRLPLQLFLIAWIWWFALRLS
jgi:uncharacterized membrane protein